MHLTPKTQAKSHVPQSCQVTQIKNGQSECTTYLTYLIKLTYHLVSLSVKMYYFALRCISINWDGLGLSLI